MSLPNWSSNPHLRRVLQRMQADYTSIFGGRDRELVALDQWLDDQENPYALLLAPTGRGKTALVWHWLERQQHEWQVIFVPISIRYGNASQADVLSALTLAFASLHDELEEFQQLQQTPSELRPKLAAYLRRELPENTRVLLVLDGLDEATGWELGNDLLPVEPPANLKILLAAREMAQHSRADWYAKLGLDASKTYDFSLQGLDRIALKELLIALGNPLDELAGDFDVLGQLLRVSAGDPVMVRLLVQLLREERIQIGQLSNLPADDLNAVFALWLQQLDGQQSQQAQLLLHLLACAYGPLSARDLLALAPETFASADEIARAIAPLARFVIGDAETGYIFSHQKLRELYRDRLDAATLAEWNARFVRYGKQAHSAPTPYLCRFLVAHLRDAGEWAFLRQLLADLTPQQAWAVSRYALEGSYSGYLRDLEVLQTWASEQQDLALSIHCSLIASSITSISSNISGKLLAQLVKIGTTQGKWSLEAALAHIEDQPSQQNGKLLALLWAEIPIPWERALSIIEQDSYLQDQAYMVLYQIVPSEFQELILAKLYQLLQRSSFINAEPLLRFCRELSQAWQTKFIQCILQADRLYSNLYEQNWQQVLAATPAEWQPQMLECLQTHTQQTLQRERAGYFYSVIQNWQFLPSEQQQIAYWSDSIEIVLNNNLTHTMLSSLTESELQVILELYSTLDINQHRKSVLSPYNLLLIQQHYLPQETHLLDQALELLYETPRLINRRIMDLLPSEYQQQIVSYLLMQDIREHNDVCAELIVCLEYFPAIPMQLIEAILIRIPYAYRELHNSYYLALIPFVQADQAVQIIEQALLAGRTINSNKAQFKLQIAFAALQPIEQFVIHSQDLLSIIGDSKSAVISFSQLLHHRPDLATLVYQHVIAKDAFTPDYSGLLEYFSPAQQQPFAQKLFDQLLASGQIIPRPLYKYLTNQQQQQALDYIKQHPHSNTSVQLCCGLLDQPNSVAQSLLPFVLAITNSELRLYLLACVLPHLNPSDQAQLHPTIISTMYERLKHSEHLQDLSSEILLVITNELIRNLEEHLMVLYQLQEQQKPSEQQRVSALIWQHIANNPQWSIGRIIAEYDVFAVCLPFFDQAQIQTALDYILEHHDLDAFSTMIPYLDQQQLRHLQTLSPSMSSSLVHNYRKAHEHHQILKHASYYQTLLEALHTQQAQYQDQWDFIEHLNWIAPYLQEEHLRVLYLNSLNLLKTRYLEPESRFALFDAIEHLQRVKLINLETILLLVRYGSRQNRNNNLTMLSYILPPYLETLESEQQQELASQIMQSVNQVVECWP